MCKDMCQEIGLLCADMCPAMFCCFGLVWQLFAADDSNEASKLLPPKIGIASRGLFTIDEAQPVALFAP